MNAKKKLSNVPQPLFDKLVSDLEHYKNRAGSFSDAESTAKYQILIRYIEVLIDYCSERDYSTMDNL